MSFDDSAVRNVASYAGGRKFDQWKDWSYPAALYYLPPSPTDWSEHPTLTTPLLVGMVYYNTSEGKYKRFNGSDWTPLPRDLIDDNDTPPDYGNANDVLKSNGTSALNWGRIDWSELTGIPATFQPSPHTHVEGDLPASIIYDSEDVAPTGLWAFVQMPTVGGRDIMPSGGQPGQSLTKGSGDDYDYAWQDPPDGVFDPAVSETITGNWTFISSTVMRALTGSSTPLVVQGATSQNADLIRVSDNGGAPLFIVSAAGGGGFAGTVVAAAPTQADHLTTRAYVDAEIADAIAAIVFPPAPVGSVFGRTGAVVAAAGDYASFYPNKSGTEVITGNWTVNGAWSFAQRIRAPAGTAAVPAYSFSSDPDTGLYSFADNRLAVAAGGLQYADFGAERFRTYYPVWAPDGSLTAPAYSFSADSNTGLYRISEGRIGVGINAGLRFDIGSTLINAYVPIACSSAPIAASHLTRKDYVDAVAQSDRWSARQTRTIPVNQPADSIREYTVTVTGARVGTPIIVQRASTNENVTMVTGRCQTNGQVVITVASDSAVNDVSFDIDIFYIL